MREIKYRAFDKTTNSMIEDYINGTDRYGEVHPKQFHASSYSDNGTPSLILMQSVGLKDKNGTDICEEDLLTDGERVFRVQYLDPILQLKLTLVSSNKKEWQKIWELSSFSQLKKLTIIGNSFSNPELIKQ